MDGWIIIISDSEGKAVFVFLKHLVFSECPASCWIWGFFQAFLVSVDDLAVVLSEGILEALSFVEF